MAGVAGLMFVVGCGSSDNDEEAAWDVSWQLRLSGNYGGPKIRMRSDADVFVDMGYAGRPEAQVTSGTAAADGTINITVNFPDTGSFTGVFDDGVITWDNGTSWTQDRTWQDAVMGTYGGPVIERRSDGYLQIDMSYATRPAAQVWNGYFEDDGSILLVVFFPDELTHSGWFTTGAIDWDNGTSWIKDL